MARTFFPSTAEVGKVRPAAGVGRNLQGLLEPGLGRRGEESEWDRRISTQELRTGDVRAGGGSGLPDQGNAKIGRTDSGYWVVPSAAWWSDTEPTPAGAAKPYPNPCFERAPRASTVSYTYSPLSVADATPALFLALTWPVPRASDAPSHRSFRTLAPRRSRKSLCSCRCASALATTFDRDRPTVHA